MLLVFLITCLSELSRTPFDLQEAESELVAGFFTEYSAFVFVAFFLSEYCSMVVLSTLTAILFFGGYNVPNIMELIQLDLGFISISSIFIGLKTCFLLFCIIWVRATLPRMRYDQLQVFC
jgi:NADH-ubiquinone oxidoreductase chain 1